MRTFRSMFRAVLALVIAFLAVGLSGINTAAAQTRPAPSNLQGNTVGVAVRMTGPAADKSITYTIVATNYGDQSLKYLDITAPLNTAAGRVVSVQSDDSRVWVSSRTDTNLVVRVETLGGDGDSVAITIRATGAVLQERLSYTWYSDETRNSGLSNAPSMLIAEGTIGRLNVTPMDSRGSGYVFSSPNPVYAPSEPVIFWFNGPDGSVTPLRVRDGSALFVKQPQTSAYDTDEGGPFASAAADGALQIMFDTSRLPAGNYTLVARGDWTGVTQVGAFQVR